MKWELFTAISSYPIPKGTAVRYCAIPPPGKNKKTQRKEVRLRRNKPSITAAIWLINNFGVHLFAR